jgi:hypothetical protein
MRKLLSLVLVLFALTHCASPRYEVEMKELNTEEIVWLVQRVAVKFKHECFLRHEHSRTLYDASGFTRIGMQFSTQDILEVDDARGLLVDFVEFLLGEINRDPLLCGQLAAYPFTADRLDIIILCESFLPEYIDPYYVGCIKLKHGYSYFYAADEKDETIYSWHSRVEPYEKSRELIMLERAAEREYRQAHPDKKPRIPDQFFP